MDANNLHLVGVVGIFYESCLTNEHLKGIFDRQGFYMKLSTFFSIGVLWAMLCGFGLRSSAAETNQVADPLTGKFVTQLAYADGKHNAFTGATAWKDQVLIVFRHGEHHVSFDGQVKVIATRDGKEYRELSTISEPGKDLRDPKIVCVGKKLLLYTGAVDEKDKERVHTDAKLYISSDGIHWKEKKMTGLYPDSWLWCVHYDGKHYYGSAYGRNNKEYGHSTLYKSRNGIDWEPFFSVPEQWSNEVSLDTGEDGALYALVRQDKFPYHPILVTISEVDKPGLFDWKPLPFSFAGPFVKRMKSGCIAIGRRWDEPKDECVFPNPNTNRRVEMIWLGDDGKIERLCTFLSGGDCSYPGWAELPDGRILISYYSSHQDGYPKVNIHAAIFDPNILPKK